MRCINYTIFAVFFLFLVNAQAKAAIFITNLSGQPQSVLVSDVGNLERVITIAPNQTWRSHAAHLWLKKPKDEGRGISARNHDHLVIWENGELIIQQRRRNNAENR